MRPGFELGYKEFDKYFIRNHLQFNILVHPTHGEYLRAGQGAKGAAMLDSTGARRLLLSKQQLLDAGVTEDVISTMQPEGRQLQADAPGVST